MQADGSSSFEHRRVFCYLAPVCWGTCRIRVADSMRRCQLPPLAAQSTFPPLHPLHDRNTSPQHHHHQTSDAFSRHRAVLGFFCACAWFQRTRCSGSRTAPSSACTGHLSAPLSLPEFPAGGCERGHRSGGGRDPTGRDGGLSNTILDPLTQRPARDPGSAGPQEHGARRSTARRPRGVAAVPWDASGADPSVWFRPPYSPRPAQGASPEASRRCGSAAAWACSGA